MIQIKCIFGFCKHFKHCNQNYDYQCNILLKFFKKYDFNFDFVFNK